MDAGLFSCLQRLVSVRLGLQLRDRDSVQIERAIQSRVKARGLAGDTEYLGLLEAAGDLGAMEWTHLSALLVNGESYFFRDAGQFALLKERILPELVRRRQAHRSLRIWSAGCSTGEEPYSIAVLIDEILRHRTLEEGWSISILGTDLNEQALETARRGIYGSWSFRSVKPGQIYGLKPRGPEEWEVEERIRNMVVFRTGNLIQDSFPDAASGIYDMNLILCRNVFIYFEGDAVRTVVRKMAEVLHPDGYLVTGHAELPWGDLGTLDPTTFPESVVYQRRPRPSLTPHARPPVRVSQPVRSHRSSLPPFVQVVPRRQPGEGEHHAADRKVDAHGHLDEAESLLGSGSYHAAIQEAEAFEQHRRGTFRALYILARAHANLGDYERSIQYCHQALEADPFAAGPYSLMASIREEQGDPEEAKHLLKKAIYLSPSFVPAYLELGALYERDLDMARARKMRETALHHLKAMPPADAVDPYGMKANDLVVTVESLLARRDPDAGIHPPPVTSPGYPNGLHR